MAARTPGILLQSVLDAQEHPAVVIDRNYNIIAANRAYCESYSISPGEILSKCCYQVSHRSTSPCHEHGEDCPHKALFTHGQPVQVLHTHYDAQGEPDYVHIKAHPLEDDAGNQYLMEVIYRLAPLTLLSCADLRMIGRSKSFLTCVDSLQSAAKTDTPVLITGESGVGKELAAEFLHSQSRRHAGPYIEINCASIPESLFESELFGHEKGAFTGSTGEREGLFEVANSGTLFLDEIGELPLNMQAKLLRVLDHGEVRRIGGRRNAHVDVRLITATNRDLRQMTQEGSFRLDLYYRIAGVTIEVPPLRERRGDIPALVEFMSKRLSEKMEMRFVYTREAMSALENYSFPGNIRELRNIVHRAATRTRDGIIDVEHLGLEAASTHICHFHSKLPQQASAKPSAPAMPSPERRARPRDGSRSIREIERDYITSLLRQHGGNRRTVALILGISERTLYRKLKLLDPAMAVD